MRNDYDMNFSEDNAGSVKGLFKCMAGVAAFGAVMLAGEVATADVEHSRGHHVGYVNAMKEQGAFHVKSGVMEMHDAPLAKGELAQDFDFSVRSNDIQLAGDLQKAADSHACVDIEFTRTHGLRPWEQITHNRVTSVRELGPQCEF